MENIFEKIPILEQQLYLVAKVSIVGQKGI
jgi:hypothetical protein